MALKYGNGFKTSPNVPVLIESPNYAIETTKYLAKKIWSPIVIVDILVGSGYDIFTNVSDITGKNLPIKSYVR